MLQIFGYISAFLSIVMVLPYIKDILRRTTKPERASWLIWTVLGIIAFASQLAKGASDSLWLTAGQTLAVGVVFLLSVPYGTGGLAKRDIYALVAAGVGLIIWYMTREAAYALIIVVLIDSLGTLLTVLKAHEDPESETFSTWVMSGISGMFGSIAVGSLNPVLLLYPVYIIVANFTVVGALLLGKKRLATK